MHQLLCESLFLVTSRSNADLQHPLSVTTTQAPAFVSIAPTFPTLTGTAIGPFLGTGSGKRKRRALEESILNLLREMEEALRRLDEEDEERGNEVMGETKDDCGKKLRRVCKAAGGLWTPATDHVLRILDDSRYLVELKEDDGKMVHEDKSPAAMLRSYVYAGQTGAFGEDCEALAATKC